MVVANFHFVKTVVLETFRVLEHNRDCIHFGPAGAAKVDLNNGPVVIDGKKISLNFLGEGCVETKEETAKTFFPVTGRIDVNCAGPRNDPGSFYFYGLVCLAIDLDSRGFDPSISASLREEVTYHSRLHHCVSWQNRVAFGGLDCDRLFPVRPSC